MLFFSLYHLPLQKIKKIFAQDLLADYSVNIMEDVLIEKKRIIIPGDLIKRIGLSSANEGDISVPGMVIKVEFN